ncbi:MAG: hypothetical protein EON97_01460, partial [Chitinophagaceae bacterium]
MSITPEMIELINTTVPKQQERRRTVFDLSGVAHNELAFTRWYEYFLDKDEDHGLSDLFLQTLLSVVGAKLKITDFGVGRNVQTKKGNFIDLLVYGQGEDEGKSVIIEIKIHHWLHNDLLDYFDDAPGSDSDKVGVLLTINQHHIPPGVKGKFVNVLHGRWLEAVVRASKTLHLTTEQFMLLDHFSNAILNLSKDLTMNTQVLFFLNNITTVNEIVATKQKTSDYILSQLDSSAAQMGFSVGG